MVGSSPSAATATTATLGRLTGDASHLEGRRRARVIPTTSSLSTSRRSSFVSGNSGLPGRGPARRRRARLPTRAAAMPPADGPGGGGGGRGLFGDWLRPLEGLVQKMGVTIYQVRESLFSSSNFLSVFLRDISPGGFPSPKSEGGTRGGNSRS
mgnify:CR=1 FL=1